MAHNLYQGIFNTSNFKPGTRPTSFGQAIWQENPMAAPLLGMLTSNGPGGQADAATLHKWQIRRYFNANPKLTAAVAAGVKGQHMAVGVDTTAGIRPNDVWLVMATNEQILVTSINGPTSMTLRRGFGPGNPSPIPVGAKLLHVSNSFEEASLRPSAVGAPNTYGGWMYNFSQIFRHAHAVTGTVASTMLQALNSASYNPDPTGTMSDKNIVIGGKAMAAADHAMAKERALLFSQPHEDTHNGMPIRTMGGLFYMVPQYAPSNYFAISDGVVSLRNLEEMVYATARHSYEGRPDAKTRIAFGGRKALRTISDLIAMRYAQPVAPAQVQMNGSYGMRYTSLTTFDGITVNFMSHPIFDAYPEMASMLLILDLNAMQVKYLPGRNAAYREWGHMADGTPQDPGQNGQLVHAVQGTEMGIDARGGDFLSELTCAIEIPTNFGIIRNVCQPGTDPVVVAVAGKTICVDFDKPCINGAIDPFEQVTLVFAGGNAAQQIQVKYPAITDATGAVVAAGTATVTLDANGNGSFSWNVGHAGAFTLCIVPTTVNSANITFPALEYTACVKECLPSNDYLVGGTITSSESNVNC